MAHHHHFSPQVQALVSEYRLLDCTSTRGFSGEVVIVTDIGDIWSNTPDIRSVRYQKDCPNDCGEVIQVERYPKPEETHAESIARTYDALVSAVGNHLAYDCIGPGGDE